MISLRVTQHMGGPFCVNQILKTFVICLFHPSQFDNIT